MIMAFLKGIGLKIWAYVVLGLFALYILHRIYKAGQDQQEVDNLKKTLDSVVRRREIEESVNPLPRSSLIDQLRKNGWIRN